MKKIKFLLIAILLCLIPTFDVDAASASISVSSSKSRVIVGETVTVTVTVSSSSNLGSWRFDVSNSSNLSLVSSSFGGLYIVDYASNANTKSKSYTFTFKATASGTGTVSIKNSEVYGYDETKMTATNGSKSFNLMTQSQLEATYSKNNYLSSISIAGYDLNPSFDKETLEYSVELPNGTESIEVSATKADSTASVKGTGTISLEEGENVVELVVTAQNGSTRTYKINIIVKELDPINVKVGNEDLTVVRKWELMPQASLYYTEGTVNINDEEVPSYYNEATNITLVALRNNMGEIKLYIYENGTFTLYEELTFNQLSIKVLNAKDDMIPEGYSKTKLDINGKSVLVYYKENSEFYLIYGLNLETGKEHLYKYDKVENTLQRYENIESNIETNYLYIIIGLFAFTILSYIIFISLIFKNNKKARQIENTMRIDIEKIKVVNEEDKVSKKEKVKEKKETKKKKKEK